MVKLKKLFGREILDSRGNPTVEATIITAQGTFTASVPSGASTGKHEALELRDGGQRYRGLGVLTAVENINRISKAIKNTDLKEQQKIDDAIIKLDGTNDEKKNLGANATLASSIAVLRANASAKGLPAYKYIAKLAKTKELILPIPAFNIINGGKHANTKLEFQEFLILPVGAKTFEEALRIGTEIYHQLKEDAQQLYGKNAVGTGDEGGLALPCACYEEPLNMILEASQKLGYDKLIKLGIDVAATSFFKGGRYALEEQSLTPKELAQKHYELATSYPILTIEDPFQEEDFESYSALQRSLGEKIHIVTDDLTTTNPTLVDKAILHKAGNCLLVKPNQIGTISETITASLKAKNAGWQLMASHRSGETTDDWIADIAVGIGAKFIKAGAPCRGERVVKYNRLLQIEKELGKKAKYAGMNEEN